MSLNSSPKKGNKLYFTFPTVKVKHGKKKNNHKAMEYWMAPQGSIQRLQESCYKWMHLLITGCSEKQAGPSKQQFRFHGILSTDKIRYLYVRAIDSKKEPTRGDTLCTDASSLLVFCLENLSLSPKLQGPDDPAGYVCKDQRSILVCTYQQIQCPRLLPTTCLSHHHHATLTNSQLAENQDILCVCKHHTHSPTPLGKPEP